MTSFVDKFAPKPKSGNVISVAAKIVRENALVYDLRLKQDGVPAYFVLEVDRPKLPKFTQALESDEVIDLVDFGTLIESGWFEPSVKTQQMLNEKYGMDYEIPDFLATTDGN